MFYIKIFGQTIISIKFVQTENFLDFDSETGWEYQNKCHDYGLKEQQLILS